MSSIIKYNSCYNGSSTTPDARVPTSEALTATLKRVSTLEKDVKELKQVDHSEVILESIKSLVPPAVNEYLGSGLGDSLQKKGILFKMMMASKSYEKHPAYKDLYDALLKSLFMDEDDMDKYLADADQSTQVKRKHDDQDEDPTTGSDQGKEKKRPRKDTQPSKKSSASKESSKGKTPPKNYKSGKSITVEEPDEEHVHEVSMDAEEKIINEMCNIKEQPDDEAVPKTENAPKYNWFKQSPRPPTLDPGKPLPLKGRPDSECGKCKGQKLHGYGYLEELIMRRADRKLYKFKEGDLVNLHLNEIEGMLLLIVQHKLFHLEGDVIVDLAVALQLYTPSYDPPRVVFEELSNQKRLMRANELYKFSDGTLKSVSDILHHRLRNFILEYLKGMSRRKWPATDQK
ncbi:hypothetical protein Tco_1329498 [Tanacetum coccineum]